MITPYCTIVKFTKCVRKNRIKAHIYHQREIVAKVFALQLNLAPLKSILHTTSALVVCRVIHSFVMV
jgi:hypothetical protein